VDKNREIISKITILCHLCIEGALLLELIGVLLGYIDVFFVERAREYKPCFCDII